MKRLALVVMHAPLLALFVGCGSSSSDGGSTGGAGATNGTAGAQATGSAGARAGSAGASTGSAGASGAGTGSAGASGAGTGSAGAGGAGTAAGAGGAAQGSGGGSTTTGGTTGVSGGTGTAGVGTAGAAGAGTAGASGGTSTAGVSVLQHHNHATRDGVYVDAALTKTAVAGLHVDTTFTSPALTGKIYAQPLYLAGTAGKPDTVVVATEGNQIYALNSASGATVWNKAYGTPVTTGLPCGNIANSGGLGITGTPIIDGATRTLYFDSMTADATVTAKHMVHAVDADSGTERAGWPVDVNAKASFNSASFNSMLQNQRTALSLLGGKVIVSYGGHIGDCAGYHGWLVGISTTDPTQVTAWSTRAIAGGIWATGGLASDGTSLFFATGNSKAMASDGPNTTPTTWGDGETVYKFGAALTRPADSATTDFFVPTNWAALDKADQDIGGTAPVLVDVAGATPSKLAVSLGKDGNAYLLNRDDLGGLDATPLGLLKVASGTIINASVVYTTATATYVVFKNGGKSLGCPTGQTGGLSAIKISKASPPVMSLAWCGGPTTATSPAMSMSSSAGADSVVWIVGSDSKLYGVDGDTGANVFTGAAALPALPNTQTPMVAKGRVFVASATQVTAFTGN